MPTLKQRLSYLILGQKGGQNRIQIIELLKDRPYNLNQLAEILNLNYRTVKHHTDILLKNELVSTSKTGGYGEVYFLTPELEGNIELFEEIVGKFDLSKKLKDFTSSSKFFQSVMEQTNDGVIIINKEGSVFFWNKSAEKLLGYKEKEILGDTSQVFPEIGIQDEMIKKVEDGEQIVAFETKLKQESGELIDVSLTMDGIKDENDNLIGFSILFRDITDHKRAEEALRESEERYRHLFENSPIGIGLSSLDGKVVTGNKAMEVITGYPIEELKKIKLSDIYVNPEDRKTLVEIINREEKVVNFPAQLKRKDGAVFDALLNVSRVNTRSEDFLQTICIDITERKHAEKALRLSEERYALAQRAASIGSWDWDILKGDLHWSEKIEPMFGFGHGEFGATYEAFLDCIHPEDRQHVVDSVNACVENGKDYAIEHRIVWPDGTVRTVSETGDVIRDENGKAIRMLGVVRDITERKRAEEEQILTIRILERLNRAGEGKKVIRDILAMVKGFTGFEAVGIRLKDGEDYPYFITKGFPGHFVEAENYLCAKDEEGNLIYNSEGNPYLECMCGNIIQGRTNPSQPFFTEGGSFWTNCTTKLLATTTEEDRLARTRNRCNQEGYESVALVPLRSGREVIGLLQLNDTHQDRFAPDMIHFFEKIGASIGIAFSRMQAMTPPQEIEKKFH